MEKNDSFHSAKRRRTEGTASFARLKDNKRYSIANEFEREISATPPLAIASAERRETLSPSQMQSFADLPSNNRRETLSPRTFLELENEQVQAISGLQKKLHVIGEASPDKETHEDSSSDEEETKTDSRPAFYDRRQTLDVSDVAKIGATATNRRETLDPAETNAFFTLESPIQTRNHPLTIDSSDKIAAQARKSSEIYQSERNSSRLQERMEQVSERSPQQKERRQTIDPTQILQVDVSPIRQPSNHVEKRNSGDRRATIEPAESLAMLQIDKRPTPQQSKRRRETIEPEALAQLDLSDDENRVFTSLKPKTPGEENVETRDISFHMGDYSIVESEHPNDSSEEETKEDPKSLAEGVISAKKAPSSTVSFQSPPNRRSTITPLKSILSGRKAKKTTTPTKTISFGSPRGAEFRVNDPSTSMTPMCDRQAKAMFPLDKDEEEEDEETSVNSSILDEANQLVDDEDTSISFPFGPMRSPRRSPKKVVIGVSPLDNMSEARRRRRASFGGKAIEPSKRQSLLGVDVMRSDSNAFIAGSAKKAKDPERSSPKSTFVDSSSEDEDMDITGEYILLPPPKVVVSNGLSDLLNENLDVPKENVLVVQSADEEDCTLDLGPVGTLASDPSLFGSSQEKSAGFMPSSLETLAPIQEESDVSRMDMSTEDEDEGEDEDYIHRRESLVVNLGDRFQKFGSSGKKKAAATMEDLSIVQPTVLNLDDSSDEDVDMGDAEAHNDVHHQQAMTLAPEEPVAVDDLFAKLNLSDIQSAMAAKMASDNAAALQAVSRYETEITTELFAAKEEVKLFVSELRSVMSSAASTPVQDYLASLYHSNRPMEFLVVLYKLKMCLVFGGWFEWRVKLEETLYQHLDNVFTRVAKEYSALKNASNIGEKVIEEAQIVANFFNKEKETLSGLEAIQDYQVLVAEHGSRIQSLENQIGTLKQAIAKWKAQETLLLSRNRSAPVVITTATLDDQLNSTHNNQETYLLALASSKWKCLSIDAAAMVVEMHCKAWNDTTIVTISIELVGTVPHATCLIKNNDTSCTLGQTKKILFDATFLENMAMLQLQSHRDIPQFLQESELELRRSLRVLKEIIVLQTDYTLSIANAMLSIRFVSQRKKIMFNLRLPLTPHIFFQNVSIVIETTTGLTKAQEMAILDRLALVPKGYRRLRQLCQCVERYLDDL